MARTEVPVRRVDRFQAATLLNTQTAPGNTVDGMTMVNNGATVLAFNSASGADETITITIVETIDFSPAAPVVVTIPANTFLGMIGPFPREFYGNALEFAVSSASVEFGGFSLL